MSAKLVIVGILAVVVLGAVIFFMPVNTTQAPPAIPLAPSAPVASAQGKVVIGISDASVPLTNVTSIMMTVEKAEIQGTVNGWVTVSNVPRQYDLLALRKSGAVSLLTDISLPVGIYNQIRLTISKVQLTVLGKLIEAKLPSGTLSIVGRIVVEDGQTSVAVLDFKADKSLHITGNGKYILAPVINLQTKSGVSVAKESDDTLKIEGGKIEEDKNVGMDENGEVKDNFELDAKAKVEIDSKGEIQIIGGTQVKTETKTEVETNTSHKVSIENFSFSQKTISIKKGDTIVWINNDAMAHTVTGNNGGPASGNIATGGTYSFTFKTAGTFIYHCAIHPSMIGTVIVTD